MCFCFSALVSCDSSLASRAGIAPRDASHISHSCGPGEEGARWEQKRRVGILVFDGVKLLDVAGPSEVFSEANRFGAGYEVMLYSAGLGRDVASSTGMRISVDAAAADAGPLELALVAGGEVLPTHPVSPELAEAARDPGGALWARRTASVCTGAFILAAAGLLDGRRFTTHWQHARTLARAHPAIEVEPDAIYVEDGPVLSSAASPPASTWPSRWSSATTARGLPATSLAR